jgi:putative redox protein
LFRRIIIVETKGKIMAVSVNAHIGRDHYQVTIKAGKNSIVGDEHEDIGGKNEGFSPSELFIASLGACTSATVRMYADRKGMNLNEVKIDLTMERDEENNITNITRNIEFVGNLTEQEKERLIQIANKCPIHKVMSNPINISTRLVV